MKPLKCKVCGTENQEDFRYKLRTKCYSCYKEFVKNTPYYNSQRSKALATKWAKENFFRFRFLAARWRAAKKHIEFTITEEDIIKLYYKQNECCFYTKLPFNNGDENLSMSIDRIDPTKGYTLDNIRLVASIVNIMKSNLQEKQFLELVTQIYDNTCNQKN